MVSRRCGCASDSCGCVVTGGVGVDVSGTGSRTNPYLIDIAPVTGVLLLPAGEPVPENTPVDTIIYRREHGPEGYWDGSQVVEFTTNGGA